MKKVTLTKNDCSAIFIIDELKTTITLRSQNKTLYDEIESIEFDNYQDYTNCIDLIIDDFITDNYKTM